MKTRLQDQTIKSAKAPANGRLELKDAKVDGLMLRVTTNGVKSFALVYKVPGEGGTTKTGKPRKGKSHRMTLGTYPAISLASARVKHANAKELLAKGTDPGALHVEKRRAERQAETVGDMAEEYLEKYAKPRKRSAGEDERILRKDVLPRWGKLKAKASRRRDVILLRDEIVERGASRAAKRTLGVIRRMFNFSISRDLLDTTPVAMVKPPAEENQRERVLSPEEIRVSGRGSTKDQ